MTLQDERQSQTELDVIKSELPNKDFLYLGFGDDWEVYIPTDMPLKLETRQLHSKFIEMPDSDREAFKAISKELRVRLREQIHNSDPEAVLKVARINVNEAGVFPYSEEQLQQMLVEVTFSYDLMKKYYGQYVEDCIFWIDDIPEKLPPRSDWEPTPPVREKIKNAEAAKQGPQALMCIQKYIQGTDSKDWIEKYGTNPHIEELMEMTVHMVRNEGKIIDLSSFIRDNIVIDAEGFPHIIDATYLVDNSSGKLDRIAKQLGRTSYTEIEPKDILVLMQ